MITIGIIGSLLDHSIRFIEQKKICMAKKFKDGPIVEYNLEFLKNARE